MQDETLLPPTSARRPRSARLAIALVLLAFLGGGALVGWLAVDGRLAQWLPRTDAGLAAPSGQTRPSAKPLATLPAPSAPQPAAIAPATDLGGMEARLAQLEQRLALLNVQAQAASGNVARAEGLLIAFAARRMIERGAPLGYLEDQLKLRFADAQPNAVQTVIDAAKHPQTLDQLAAQLSAAAPALEQAQRDETAWGRFRRELASLFVVRRGAPATPSPEDRLLRAQIMLQAGRVDAAIVEVEALPGSDGAVAWIAAARRYAAAQRALELIETAAMLEPHRLQDSAGQKVDQPSPLAEPALPVPVPVPLPAPQTAPASAANTADPAV